MWKIKQNKIFRYMSRPQNKSLSQTSSEVKDTGIRYSARFFAPYVFLQRFTALVARAGNVKTFLFPL